ncbi:MAG: iron-containing alcohol dehydrogenase [Clostridia bacterium]|nr:iron-containing alcohol dehydrogenase [Clostridia bacterium]
MEYFLEVTKNTRIDEFLHQLNNNTLVIYSPTSLKKLKGFKLNASMIDWHTISKNTETIQEIMDKYQYVDEIVSFGGGSTIDIAKYISYKLNKRHICIPSMLSTNTYATNKVALLVEGKKITLDAKMPDLILLDNDFLRKSPEENLFGFADVLSIHTALYDWKIANQTINEKIDNNVYEMAKNLLEKAKLYIEINNYDMIEYDVENLYKFIGEAGYITNLYGTGRPESGSEHIFAKELESILDVPHGLSVSIGIILMTMLQMREEDEIVELIRKIKVLDYSKKYNITVNEIRQAFLNLKPRENRFSIVDINNENISFKEQILKEFIKKQII